MALNCVVGHEPSTRYISTNRSFYPSTEKNVLFGGLEVWRGYFQAVKPGQGIRPEGIRPGEGLGPGEGIVIESFVQVYTYTNISC